MEKSIKSVELDVYTSQNLSVDDISVLSLLYAPLIGSNALQIYLSLSSMCSKTDHHMYFSSHSALYDTLHMKEQDYLKARFSLEAVNLLNVYAKDDSIMYILYLPQSASQFIKNGVLGIYLNSLIGQDNLNKVLEVFSKNNIDYSEYQNITKSFDEVYSVTNVSKEAVKSERLLEARRAHEVNLTNDSFNMDYFLKNIDTVYLDNYVDDKFKSTILNVATAFNLNADDLISLYNQSIAKNQKFSYVLFKRKARMMFNITTDNAIPSLVQNNVDEDEPKKENKNDLLAYFEKISGKELLAQFDLSNSRNNLMLANIYQDIPYSRTIVNMMVWNVLTRDNDHLPALGYFESMYNTMRDNGVIDEKTAYAYLFNNVTNKEKTKKTNRSLKNVNDPDWVKKAQKTLFDSVEVYDEEN
ncbi:MAG: hypothetical protein K6G28_02385 [Acholeplasmatales bacterium]|nr:hypothetical protein [Acholeplasmatales bacterium]